MVTIAVVYYISGALLNGLQCSLHSLSGVYSVDCYMEVLFTNRTSGRRSALSSTAKQLHLHHVTPDAEGEVKDFQLADV